jgi:hypothetical protein
MNDSLEERCGDVQQVNVGLCPHFFLSAIKSSGDKLTGMRPSTHVASPLNALSGVRHECPFSRNVCMARQAAQLPDDG